MPYRCNIREKMMFFEVFRVAILAILFVLIIVIVFGAVEEHGIERDWIITRASELHGNQKYDTFPYSHHLKAVVENVDKYSDFYGSDPDLINTLRFAGAFHDTIEDVPSFSYNDLRKEAKKVLRDEFYVNMAAEIVYACSNDKGRNRKERAGEKYYEGIRKTGYAPFIKACDRLANIEYSKEHESRMLDVYKKEMPEFLKHIEEEDNPIPQKIKEKLCQYLQD